MIEHDQHHEYHHHHDHDELEHGSHEAEPPHVAPPKERSSLAIVDTTEIAVPAPMEDLQIEIQDPGGSVRRVPLVDGVALTIGSRRGADVRVADQTVSSRHCVVVAQRGAITVKDLRSRNGTFVGGARVVNEVSCQVGMTVVIGQTTITFIQMNEQDEVAVGIPLPGIAGGSKVMCKIATLVRRFAKLRAPVLITGETGVGKELIARAIHAEGSRSLGPFVAINASTLPRELVETELFGHERGAFTGAVNRRAGAFDIAEGGTLFLDEIGELPLDAQPKLLRVLDGYEVRAVGATSAGRRMDVRVVCATHVPLAQQVRLGRFRRDLFHRLEVLVIRLPPLRERRGDILAIARALLDTMREEYGDRALTPSAVGILAAHHWPGNVRELKNVLTRALDNGKPGDPWIEPEAIRQALHQSGAGTAAAAAADAGGVPVSPRASTSRGAMPRPKPFRMSITPLEAYRILAHCNGNISAASRAANLPRTTFRKILQRQTETILNDGRGVRRHESWAARAARSSEDTMICADSASRCFTTCSG